jgi:hypothetical protein
MFAETCRQNIIILAEAYGRVMALPDADGKIRPHGLAWVSNHIYGNGTFFRELAAQRRSISVERYSQMLADIAANWPRDRLREWPKMVPIVFSPENLVGHQGVTTKRRRNRAKRR